MGQENPEEIERIFADIERYISAGGTIPRDFALRQVKLLASAIKDPHDAPTLLIGYTRRSDMTLGATYSDLVSVVNAATASQQPSGTDAGVKAAAANAGKAAADAVSGMKTKTKRNIAIGIAVAIVAIIAIAIITTVVGNVQEQQRLEAEHQELVDSLSESQLIASVNSSLKDGTWPVSVKRNDNNPQALDDYTARSVTINDKQSTDNLMTAGCTVVISNGDVEQTTEATAHLIAEGGAWNVESWDFGESSVRAIKEISASTASKLGYPIPEGSTVNFDEAAQTCAVTYKASGSKWFGGETGDISYTFKFTDSGWQLESDKGEVKTKFNGDALKGTYNATNSYNEDKNVLTSLTIGSVDESTGAISASYEYVSGEGATETGSIEGEIDAGGEILLEGSVPVHARFSGSAGASAGTIEDSSFDASYGTTVATSNTYTLTKQ